MTGMLARVMAATVSANSAPPLSFTLPTPPSATSRPALRTANSTEVW